MKQHSAVEDEIGVDHKRERTEEGGECFHYSTRVRKITRKHTLYLCKPVNNRRVWYVTHLRTRLTDRFRTIVQKIMNLFVERLQNYINDKQSRVPGHVNAFANRVGEVNRGQCATDLRIPSIKWTSMNLYVIWR
jgi:hypothetical protein